MSIAALLMVLLSCLAQESLPDTTSERAPTRRIHIKSRISADGEIFDFVIAVPRTAKAITRDEFVLEADNLDRLVFGQAINQKQREQHLMSLLSNRLDEAAATHKLTPPEFARLRLAGKGDIKRFFDAIAETRNQFEVQRLKWDTAIKGLRDIAPLAKVFEAGPFDKDSLFAKTLRGIEKTHARAGGSERTPRDASSPLPHVSRSSSPSDTAASSSRR